jgi:hypothetical protein
MRSSPPGPALAAVLLLAASTAGCNARVPARDATYGVLDALQDPPRNDTLAREVRTLVQAYVERALQAGPPEDLGHLTEHITSEILKAVDAHAPQERSLVQGLVSGALRAGMATLRQEMPAIEQTGARLAPVIARHAGEAGALVVRGAIEETRTQMEREPGGVAGSRLADGVVLLAQRSAGAAVRGVRDEIATCRGVAGAQCEGDPLRSASRSIVMGAIDGVRRELGVWLLIVAFALGLLVAGTGAAIVWAAGGGGGG